MIGATTKFILEFAGGAREEEEGVSVTYLASVVCMKRGRGEEGKRVVDFCRTLLQTR